MVTEPGETRSEAATSSSSAEPSIVEPAKTEPAPAGQSVARRVGSLAGSLALVLVARVVWGMASDRLPWYGAAPLALVSGALAGSIVVFMVVFVVGAVDSLRRN
ncbi:MAG: hypothetical protein L0G99_03095 [Propionibacteriales bacterium]|nr:hypothetical protein [Propionibacteriales bacterium]